MEKWISQETKGPKSWYKGLSGYIADGCVCLLCFIQIHIYGWKRQGGEEGKNGTGRSCFRFRLFGLALALALAFEWFLVSGLFFLHKYKGVRQHKSIIILNLKGFRSRLWIRLYRISQSSVASIIEIHIWMDCMTSVKFSWLVLWTWTWFDFMCVRWDITLILRLPLISFLPLRSGHKIPMNTLRYCHSFFQRISWQKWFSSDHPRTFVCCSLIYESDIWPLHPNRNLRYVRLSIKNLVTFHRTHWHRFPYRQAINSSNHHQNALHMPNTSIPQTRPMPWRKREIKPVADMQ